MLVLHTDFVLQIMLVLHTDFVLHPQIITSVGGAPTAACTWGRSMIVIYSDNLSLDRLYKLFAGLSNHFLLQVQSEEVYAHGHARDTINQ